MQSHVVSGCVGNRAAVFPQQLLGLDVDFINSVHFSNHTGYPVIKGTVMNGGQLDEITEGLHSNELEDYDFLLTGYIGSESFLMSILNLLNTIQRANPNIRYICDPVFGDNGNYYVPKSLVDIFIRNIIPRAYMITPNQFEAELLSGIKIACVEDARRAMIALHTLGPKVVVLTSCELREYPGRLCCCVLEQLPACSTLPITGEQTERGDVSASVRISQLLIDKLQGHFTGTGDATAGLLLAWHQLLGDEHAGKALQNAVASMQGILKLTIENKAAKMKKHFLKHSKDGNTIEDFEFTKAQLARFSELSIVQGKEYIINPPMGEISFFEEITLKLDEIL